MRPPDPVAMVIELMLDDEPSIAAAERTIDELLSALEIPVAPRFARAATATPLGRLVGVGGRAIRIGPADRLDLRRLRRLAGAFITHDVTRAVWRAWIGDADDPGTLTALRRMLSRGAQLGYRLSRFRAIAEALHREQPPAAAQIELFENAIDGEDCGRLRMRLRNDALGDALGEDESRRLIASMPLEAQGLILPPSSIHHDRGAHTAWSVEWNDLRLPYVELPDVPDAAEANLVAAALAAVGESDGALVNRSLAALCLIRLRDSHPVLARTLEQTFDIGFLTRVLRELVAEGLSLRDIAPIAIALLELPDVLPVDLAKLIAFAPLGVYPVHPGSPPAGDLDSDIARSVEYIRMALKRQITARYTTDNSLKVLLASPDLEARLRTNDPLTVVERMKLMRAVERELRWVTPPVLLTSPEVRRRFRDELRIEVPELDVLSYLELSPDINITPMARIELE